VSCLQWEQELGSANLYSGFIHVIQLQRMALCSLLGMVTEVVTVLCVDFDAGRLLVTWDSVQLFGGWKGGCEVYKHPPNYICVA
jgi:hypothetical protein